MKENSIHKNIQEEFRDLYFIIEDKISILQKEMYIRYDELHKNFSAETEEGQRDFTQALVSDEEWNALAKKAIALDELIHNEEGELLNQDNVWKQKVDEYFKDSSLL